MLDNDEPWKPPELQKLTQAPKLLPQVPEVTIISTENKQSSVKHNFIQRAKLTENIFKPKVIEENHNNNRAKFQPVENRYPIGQSYQNPVTNILKEDNRAYPQILTKPSVPDITILDDSKETSKKSTEKVFTNSYKEMLINSHDQFLKQLSRDQSPTTSIPSQVPLSRFKQNPLSKYIPSPQEMKTFNNNLRDGNSSSILSDIDASQNHMNAKKGENEEVTFKKVAEMLSEIQKLVVTEKLPIAQSPNSSSSSDKSREVTKKSNDVEILKQLAKSFLTTEELARYKVDSELSELEKC